MHSKFTDKGIDALNPNKWMRTMRAAMRFSVLALAIINATPPERIIRRLHFDATWMSLGGESKLDSEFLAVPLKY